MTNPMPTIEVDAKTVAEVCDMAEAWLDAEREAGINPVDQPEDYEELVDDAMGTCEQTDELRTKVAEETDLLDE